MAENLTCTVVTPSHTVFQGEASYVALPGETGGFGVMKDHEPLVSNLAAGIMRITGAQDGSTSRFVLSEGYAQINNNEVIVIVENAVKVDDIDLAAVKNQLSHVEEELAATPEGDAHIPFYREEEAWLKLQLAACESRD